MMGKTVGRAIEDMRNRSLGRVPYRFHFEIVPERVEDLPQGVTEALVAWEKGDKISFTDPAPVEAATRTAAFNQAMRQNATIYREDNTFRPKEYTFKVQAPSSSSAAAAALSTLALGEPHRRTIARAKLDLTQFCTASPQLAEEQHTLQLHPRGKLQLTIRTQWLSGLQQPQVEASSNSMTETFTEASVDDPYYLYYSRDHADPSSPLGSPGGSPHSDQATQFQSSSSRGPGPREDSSSSSTADYDLRGLTTGSAKGRGRPGHRRSASAPFVGDVVTILEEGESTELQGELPAAAAANRGAAAAAAAAPRAAAGSSGRVATQAAGGSAAAGGAASSGSTTGAASWGSGLWSSLASSFVHSAAGGSGPGAAAGPLARDAATRGGSVDQGLGEGGMPRLFSGQFPKWMWPNGRESIKGMTTDQLMNAIQGSDLPSLQMLARGLLAERNDHRYQATQGQRQLRCREEELGALRGQLAALGETCRLLEGQLTQMTETDLVRDLVQAKLELAESDSSLTAARGQLRKEQERSRKLAARLTKLESEHERLLHEHWAAQQGEGQGWGH